MQHYLNSTGKEVFILNEPPVTMCRAICFSAILLFAIGIQSAVSQDTAANPDDVSTIESIVTATYA